jgi:chaperone required for assembly of F1-ATPase
MAHTADAMKRFYKAAAAVPVEDGHEIRLDGRPVRTPGRAPLRVPTRALAEAIAAEWDSQGEEIDPRGMILTGLANAAIDRIAPDPLAFAAGLAAYGESDLLCYRADNPDALIARQERTWRPLLAWARHRFDVEFEVTSGIMHRPQHAATVERLRKAVEARDAFALAGLSPLVTVSGSLVIALALAEDAIDVAAAWEAATLDERWQTEHWGEDAEAAAALAGRLEQFEGAARFLELLGR